MRNATHTQYVLMEPRQSQRQSTDRPRARIEPVYNRYRARRARDRTRIKLG